VLAVVMLGVNCALRLLVFPALYKVRPGWREMTIARVFAARTRLL
jgi:hypothetical protein